MYPGIGKMIRDNKKAAQRKGHAGSESSGEGPEAYTETGACATCGAEFPRNQMFVTEGGEVCAEHFKG